MHGVADPSRRYRGFIGEKTSGRWPPVQKQVDWGLAPEHEA